MGNAIFLLDNRADTAAVSASSAAAGMPPANVQSEFRSDVWRSAPGTYSYLDFTFSGSSPVSCAGFVDTNLSSVGNIRIRAWTDGIGAGTLVYDNTIRPNVYGQGISGNAYGMGAYGVGNYGLSAPISDLSIRNVTILQFPAPVLARYWRIEFGDENTSYQQLSRVFLGVPKTFTNNVSYGWKAAREERSPRKESLGGQRFSQRRDSRARLECAFDWLLESERADILTILQTYGEIRPIIFSIYAETSLQGLTTSLYGTFSDASTEHRNYNITQFPFTINEEF